MLNALFELKNLSVRHQKIVLLSPCLCTLLVLLQAPCSELENILYYRRSVDDRTENTKRGRELLLLELIQKPIF